jgi:hypothetical protein
LIWPRIGTGGGRLWMRWWTLGFYKMCGIYWPAKDLLASQEGLYSRELVSLLVRQRWQGSIKTDIIELGQENVEWIKMAQDLFQ